MPRSIDCQIWRQTRKTNAVDKLDLLGILAFWQSADTQHMEANLPTISLQEYLGLNSELQTAIAVATLLRTFLAVCFACCLRCLCPNLCGDGYTSHELDEAQTLLADCSEGDAMTLMVAIPQQLRDGCYGVPVALLN